MHFHNWLSFPPLCYFHIPQESISRLSYVLLGTDAHTTQPGRAATASPTHRTHCSSLPCPALSRQPSAPAGRAGERLPREPFIMVINALCFTKFHQSSRPHQSKTIILYAFFFFSFCMNIYAPRKRTYTIGACVMGPLETVCTSVRKLCVGPFISFSQVI